MDNLIGQSVSSANRVQVSILVTASRTHWQTGRNQCGMGWTLGRGWEFAGLCRHDPSTTCSLPPGVTRQDHVPTGIGSLSRFPPGGIKPLCSPSQPTGSSPVLANIWAVTSASIRHQVGLLTWSSTTCSVFCLRAHSNTLVTSSLPPHAVNPTGSQDQIPPTDLLDSLLACLLRP
jgi:hypothetical protein